MLALTGSSLPYRRRLSPQMRETASGWLRFGVTAQPKHGPPFFLR